MTSSDIFSTIEQTIAADDNNARCEITTMYDKRRTSICLHQENILETSWMVLNGQPLDTVLDLFA